MKSTALGRRVRARLRAIRDPEVKAGAERYFKHQLRFVGVKTTALRAVACDLWPEVKPRPTEEIISESLALIRSEYMEERQIGIEFLWRGRRRLDEAIVARLEPVFDEVIRDWGTCDAICGRILRPMIARRRVRARLFAWSRSANPWRRRAAAVAFVNDARRGSFTQEILTICENIVRSPERFPQLGMGWVLRELSLVDREVVLAFLRRHYPRVTREGLRYALEKLPRGLQKELLREHSAAAKPNRATQVGPNG